VQYLLDTNWIAAYLRANATFVTAIDDRRSAGIGMSVVTLAELFSGVSQSTQPSRAEDHLRRFARGCQILGIDERVARIWGQEDARLSMTGQKIGDVDLFIAATARAHGLTRCTQNRKHFERIEGLKIESV
jgi:predicted nucleic acid-binding protein